jgi:hypothetical protein
MTSWWYDGGENALEKRVVEIYGRENAQLS